MENITPTGYRYTSQRWDSGLGLYDYNARYYDPAIGKFISADTLVPDPAAPQAFNRYAYVLGNPLRYTDPTGHCAENGDEICWSYAEQISREYGIPLEFLSLMNMSQIRFFVTGLNEAGKIDNNLPQEMILAINRMHEIYPDWINHLNGAVRLDVLGIRIEGGAGKFIGGQIDLDILFNFQSWEMSIMITPGFQVGAVLGGSGGAGLLFGFNAPNNDTFWGGGWGATVAFAAKAGGGIQYNNHGSAWSLVLGGNAGYELDVTVGVGYTLEIYRYSSNPYGSVVGPGYGVWFPQWYYWQGLSYR